jgi:hypothetical protein
MSVLARRCARCGDIDKYGRRRAVVKLSLCIFVAAIVITALLTCWAHGRFLN